MGPEPAVNAVYYNRIMELEGDARAAFVRERREEFQKDIDVFRLASDMFVDAVVPPSELRSELIKRLGYADTKQHRFPPRRNGVYPV